MSARLERWAAPLTLLLLLSTTLLFLAPALRPGYALLAADLPYMLDPLWQPLRPDASIGGPNPLLGDQFYQFHPWTVAAWQMVANGEWPIWNPAINGGQPLFGNGLAGILSPFNLLGQLLPFPASNLVGTLLRLWVAGGFTYLYARAIGLSLWGSWLAMLVFTFSGPLISWLWGTPSHVLAWLPALLWTGEKLLAARHLRWALATAISLALLILSGQPEVAFQIGTVWAIYLLGRAWWLEGGLWPALRRHGKWWALVAVLGLGLAAVEILGFVDALRQSVIFHHRQIAESVSLSAWLRRVFFNWQEWPTLITAFMPHFLGREQDDSYWYPAGNSVENNAYAGVLPLLLALLALWTSWRTPDLRTRRWIWLWGGIGAGTLALALTLPPVALLGEIPPLNLTVLGRLRGPYVFALAILAGFGLDLLIAQKPLHRPFALLLIGAAAANILLGAAAYLGFTRFADQLIASGNAFMEANVGKPGLDRPLIALYLLVLERHQAKLAMLRPSNLVMYLPVWVAVLTSLLLWLQNRRRLALVWFAPLLIAITWLDLTWVGGDFNRAVPVSWLEPTPRAIEYLQQQPGPFRVVATQQILNPNMSMLTQLEDVRGYDALATNRYRDLLAGMEGFYASGFHHYFLHLDDPRLDLLNATYGLSDTKPTHPRWEYVGSDYVYRSNTVLPRAFLVYQADIVATPAESLTRTLDPAFNPRQSVVLEAPPAAWTPPPTLPTQAGQVSFSERRATSLQLEIDTPAPALLVLLDSYSPGWRATVDDQPAPIYPANHAFRAVIVPAGQHSVTFTYAPPLLWIGAWISLGTLVVVAGLLVWLLANGRRVEQPQ